MAALFREEILQAPADWWPLFQMYCVLRGPPKEENGLIDHTATIIELRCDII